MYEIIVLYPTFIQATFIQYCEHNSIIIILYMLENEFFFLSHKLNNAALRQEMTIEAIQNRIWDDLISS